MTSAGGRAAKSGRPHRPSSTDAGRITAASRVALGDMALERKHEHCSDCGNMKEASIMEEPVLSRLLLSSIQTYDPEWLLVYHPEPPWRQLQLLPPAP